MKRILQFFFILSVNFSFAQSLNWQLTVPPHARNVSAIQLFQNGKVLAVGGNPQNDSIRFVSFTENGINNWNIIVDVPGTPMLRDMSFVDNGFAVAVGDAASIIKSTDAGSSWTEIIAPNAVYNRQFTGVDFVNEQVGVVVGGQYSSDSIASIIRTENGGTSWTVVKDEMNPQLNDVCFINTTTVFAVGNDGLIFKSSDAGLNWTVQTVPVNVSTRNFNAIYFQNENLGFIVGGNLVNDSIQTILKTVDGGSNWFVMKDEISPMLQDVHFYDANNGLCVGNNGAVLKTTDAGDNWQSVSLPNVDELWYFNSVYYLNENNAAIGGNVGAVFLSYDSAAFYNNIKNHLESEDFSIFPNPSEDYIKLKKYNSSKISKIEIINLTGQKIVSFEQFDNFLIDIEFLNSGYYYLNIIDQNLSNHYYKFLKK